MGISAEKLKTLMNMEEEPEHKAERTHTNLGIYAVQKRLEYVYHGKAKNDDHIGTGEGNSGSAGNSFEKAKEIMENGTSGNDIG